MYRGYYDGVYYDNVINQLLQTNVIHADEENFMLPSDSKAALFIPKEAIEIDGHHYHVFSDIGVSMDEAQQFCESIGGHLATVGSDEKNSKLFSLINENGYDNEFFDFSGNARLISGDPVTYEKVNPLDDASDYYGLFYWKYDGVDSEAGKNGSAFICEWDC